MKIRPARTKKLFLGILISVALLFSCSCAATACTGLYVGPEASDDGTILLARSNDLQQIMPTHMRVVPRLEDEPGRTMPLDVGQTVFVELPATTYHYTCTPWMESCSTRMNYPPDTAACTNEYGVAMTIAVTAFTNEKALSADPLIKTGVTENTVDHIVVCQSVTAREAVEKLLALIDEYGSAECNIAMITDQEESWYVEMYTGHQYAAVKLPRDAVCFYGNEFSLEYLSEFEDRIVSEGLESVAAENGFAVYGESGELNLFETYSGTEMLQPYCHMRTWIGHKVMSPSQYGDYDGTTLYPLVFRPDHKVSLSDAMELMRNRYEGTEYDPDETGRIDMRVVGTDTAMSVHVLQIYKELPANMACVSWISTGPCVYGVFVPLSNLCTGVSETYSADQSAAEDRTFDPEHYPWYAYKELNTIGMTDPAVYGAPVRAYWKRAEADMIRSMAELLEKASRMGKTEAAEIMTDYCSAVQKQAFEDAGELLNLVRWDYNRNSNTLKVGRNPETGEFLTTERVLDPVEIPLTGEGYRATE